MRLALTLLLLLTLTPCALADNHDWFNADPFTTPDPLILDRMRAESRGPMLPDSERARDPLSTLGAYMAEDLDRQMEEAIVSPDELPPLDWDPTPHPGCAPGAILCP